MIITANLEPDPERIPGYLKVRDMAAGSEA